MTPESAPSALAAGADDLVVNVADFGVARGRGRLVTSGLGSCVALALFDRRECVAGLAHILLPAALPGPGTPRAAKFADLAVPMLVLEMRRAGATGPLTAKLVGGSRMFGSLLASGVNMGERNVAATRSALRAARIPVVGEDVGGEYGRSIVVDVATFTVHVTSLQRGARVI
jgi:chemotaxis protein CheD